MEELLYIIAALVVIGGLWKGFRAEKIEHESKVTKHPSISGSPKTEIEQLKDEMTAMKRDHSAHKINTIVRIVGAAILVLFIVAFFAEHILRGIHFKF